MMIERTVSLAVVPSLAKWDNGKGSVELTCWLSELDNGLWGEYLRTWIEVEDVRVNGVEVDISETNIEDLAIHLYNELAEEYVACDD